MNWYDNIEKTTEETAKTVTSFSTNEMDKLGKLMRKNKYSSFAGGSLTASMLRYGMVGAAAGLLAGLLAKKNIMLLTLAGTGVGSLVGYVIDVRADHKTEKEAEKSKITNSNTNDTEELQ